LKPKEEFLGHIHWNGNWDLEKLYHDSGLEGEVMDPEVAAGRKLGDYLGDGSFIADKNGEFYDEAIDPKINLFG